MHFETSVRVYRCLIPCNVNLIDFACKTPNCVMVPKSPWRCTYHGEFFSTNIFYAKQIDICAVVAILFTQTCPEDKIKRILSELLDSGVNDIELTLINWVEKCHTPFKDIMLDTLYDELNNAGDSMDHIFHLKKKNNKTSAKKVSKKRVRGYARDFYKMIDHVDDEDATTTSTQNNPHLDMNMEKFGALILKPFPHETNMTIEVYPSGILNVTGINDQETFERVKDYIRNTLYVPLSRSL